MVYITVTTVTNLSLQIVENITDPNATFVENYARLRKVPRAMRNFSYLNEFFDQYVRRAETGNHVQEISTWIRQ